LNLADMLCYADIHDLSRIARNYECDCSSNSKNELIQSILARVNRKEVFESLVTGLETEDVRFLNSLLFDRRDSFSLEELIARASQTKFPRAENETWNPRELITRFKHRGWLFNGHSQQTKYLFRVPEDLKRRFGETLGAHFSKKLIYLPRPPQVYRDEQLLLAGDLTVFLRSLGEQAMPLNAEGFLYKRQLAQLLEAMSVTEEPVGKTAWRFGYGRKYKEYPARFSFLYDYCYFNGWLDENGNQLSLTSAGEARAEDNRKEDPAALYTFWLRLYKGPVPNLLSLSYWINKLSKSWVAAQSLQSVLSTLIKPYYYDTPESILESRVLPMMMHLGLLRLGADEEYGTVLQMTRLGSGIVEGTYVAEEDRIEMELRAAHPVD